MLDEKMREIYLDNAATTKVDSEVLDSILPFLKEKYGNPGSMHNKGMEAKTALAQSRKIIAGLLNCSENEIIFTGSGTESDNLAILGYARKNKNKCNQIKTTAIEHHAVLYPFEQLEKEGFEVTFLEVDKDGLVDIDKFKKAITKKTIFASIIYANNEIGVIQDIKEISKICRENNVVLHTDACQAGAYLSVDVRKLGVDMMTLNGSKIYGPKGVGILYKKKNLSIEPTAYGGGQEFGLRPATENIASIVGVSKALEKAVRHRNDEVGKLTKLRDYFIENLLKIKETRLNGHPTKRLPNNANISFLNVEGESLLLHMNEYGIYASTGSACSSSSLEPSHVVTALGLPSEVGHSSIRFSLGKETTKEDIDYTIEKIMITVEKLRKMSALNDTMDEILQKGEEK